MMLPNTSCNGRDDSMVVRIETFKYFKERCGELVIKQRVSVLCFTLVGMKKTL